MTSGNVRYLALERILDHECFDDFYL